MTMSPDEVAEPKAERLAAIRERADKAVEGPWFYDGYSRVMSLPRVKAVNEWDKSTPHDMADDDPRWKDEPRSIMAKTENITWVADDGKPHGDLGTVEGEANAQFIAHARDDIPWLLGRLAETQAELATAREAFKRHLEDECI